MLKPRGFPHLFLGGLFCLNFILSPNTFASGSKDKDAVAKVNGEVISKEDFRKKLESMNFVTKDNKEEEQKTKREALELLITDKLVEQKAKKLDLNQDKEWKQREEKFSLEFLVDLLYRKEIAEKVQVSDSEITTYYNENLDNLFTKPEQFKVSHILVNIEKDSLKKDNSQNEKKALEKIESIYQKAKTGEDFATLAKQFSEEVKTREKGGELGFLPRGRMLNEFEEQIDSLKLGEVSRPFKTKYGYHILKYSDKLPAETMELNDDLKNRIKLTLTKEKEKKRAEEFLTNLKGQIDYLFNDEVLNQHPDSVQDDPWVLIMDNQDTIKFSRYKGDLEPYKNYLKKDSLSLEDKRKLLQDYSSLFNLLVLEVRRQKYDTLTEYIKAMDDFRFKEAKRRITGESTIQDYKPSDEEIYDYYLAHRHEFPPDSTIHVYHIIFNDSLRAEEVYKKIQEGADFVEMAKEYYPGEKEIRDVAYDLGFISDKEISPEFYKVAAQLDVGEVSHPVKTEWGYHLIKVVEKRNGSPVELYKERLRNLVTIEKQKKAKAEWEKKLREGEQVWVNEKAVKKFKLESGKQEVRGKR